MTERERKQEEEKKREDRVWMLRNFVLAFGSQSFAKEKGGEEEEVEEEIALMILLHGRIME